MKKIISDLPLEGLSTQCLYLRSRRLTILQAVSRQGVGKIEALNEQRRMVKGESNKRALLESCWTLSEDLKAILSPLDVKRRAKARKEGLAKLNNGNCTINATRLCIRNLPPHVDTHLLQQGLVCQLEALKTKQPQVWSGESSVIDASNILNNNINDLNKIELKKQGKLNSKMKEMGIVSVRMILDPDQESKSKRRQSSLARPLASMQGVSEGALVSLREQSMSKRTRGFAFVCVRGEIDGLRIKNSMNASDVFGKSRRPIVEFAIDDNRKAHIQELKLASHESRREQAKASRNMKVRGEEKSGGGERVSEGKRVSEVERKKVKSGDRKIDKKLNRGARQREARRKARESNQKPNKPLTKTVKTVGGLARQDRTEKVANLKKKVKVKELNKTQIKQQNRLKRSLQEANEPDQTKSDLELRAMSRRRLAPLP
eukprot:GHVN01030020.1.p1 GENE.GHVN01030020.1~~GHVN01030020.1.p1  ORF type:complete len:431 (+),score=82.86 GHVN01030020.1:3-1295(+)